MADRRDSLRPALGQWIDGRYQLVRLIGEGSMGIVFEARHKLMDTTYALKFLQEDLAVQPKLAERFLREARIAGRIDNAHVARVFDVNEGPGGVPYMVMELLTGETLRDRCRRQDSDPLDAAEIDDLIRQILDGVAAAHRIDVVHRDLKPSNVMLTQGDAGQRVVKVLDFGLAKLLDGGASGGLTEPGTVIGTAHYMAPEQAFGEGVDQRADVFALGVIFFELIAGRRPVDGESPAEIASAYRRGRARRLTDCAPDVDPELAAAIHRALAPQPEDRFPSAAAFQEALAKVPRPAPQQNKPAPARDSSAPESSVLEPPVARLAPATPWPPALRAAIVAAVLCSLIALGWLLWM